MLFCSYDESHKLFFLWKRRHENVEFPILVVCTEYIFFGAGSRHEFRTAAQRVWTRLYWRGGAAARIRDVLTTFRLRANRITSPRGRKLNLKKKKIKIIIISHRRSHRNLYLPGHVHRVKTAIIILIVIITLTRARVFFFL